MAWIESGEAAEGRDQRRGKHNEDRHDPHLRRPGGCDRGCNRLETAPGEKYTEMRLQRSAHTTRRQSEKPTQKKLFCMLQRTSSANPNAQPLSRSP